MGGPEADPGKETEATENAELVLFQAKECYVYLIPPRKSAASYRADEWNINKWNWEGVIKVVSKGEECTIRLQDQNTGELYAQAQVREGQPLPVEAVIDSSRFFVLRVEDNSGPQTRHAFIGIGFRDRVPAYDFQAAVYDHMKYLNKKKQAEELVQEYESKPSMDYSLKDGETIHLKLKPVKAKESPVSTSRSIFFDQNIGTISPPPAPPQASAKSPTVPVLSPPPSPSVPISSQRASTQTSSDSTSPSQPRDDMEDDFGDFQTAS